MKLLFAGTLALAPLSAAQSTQTCTFNFDDPHPLGATISTLVWEYTTMMGSNGLWHDTIEGVGSTAYLQIQFPFTLQIVGISIDVCVDEQEAGSYCGEADALIASAPLLGCHAFNLQNNNCITSSCGLTGPTQTLSITFSTLDDYVHEGYIVIDNLVIEYLSDCNQDGVPDEQEIATGQLSDCDANGIPDTCDIDGDPSLDLDGNGILDSCEATQVVWTQSPINGRYYTSLPPMTWAEAEAIAVSYGGHLATVRSQEENDWVAAFYGLDQAWIGLNDLATEGSFGWSSGESLLFTNWAPGSPGGFAPDQDFVAISGLDGNWNDWFAGTLYPGIVEVGGADCDDDTRPDDYEIATAPENDWNGDGILDVCVPPNYCEGAPNSATPDGGVMSISGSPLISDNDVELRATGLPGSQWSFFIMSRTQASVPGFGGSQGVLCLGAPQYRFNRSALGEIAQTTPLGVRSLALDLTNLPQGVVMLPGETWNFQLWYRDQNPGQTSNTTDGLEVLFR